MTPRQPVKQAIFKHSPVNEGLFVYPAIRNAWSNSASGYVAMSSNGMFRVSPPFELKKLEAIFKHKVFRMLLAKGKIRSEMIDMLAKWRHSGFHVFCGNRIWPKDFLYFACQNTISHQILSLNIKIPFRIFDSIPDDIWSYISNEVATYFDVNPPVVEAQIKKESIIQKIPIRGKDLKP